MPTAVRWARLWAVLGVSALLLKSASALGVEGWAATVATGLGPVEWFGLIGIVLLFAWGEGHRALIRSWAPFVARRAHSLDSSSHPFHLVLAPLWATGLVGSSRALVLRAWTAVGAIVLAVAIVRAIPHPLRGMIQLGVAVALMLGVGGLVWRYFSYQASSSTESAPRASSKAST